MTDDAAEQLGRRLRTPRTIWLRTRTMPRSFVVLTYAVALVLMVSVSYSLWIVLLFPAWVAVISVYILLGNLRGGARSRLPDPT